jgi:hypothetical protein
MLVPFFVKAAEDTDSAGTMVVRAMEPRVHPPSAPVPTADPLVEKRKQTRELAKRMAQQVENMLDESIAFTTPNEWRQFVFANVEEFDELARAVHQLMRRVGVKPESIERHAKLCDDTIARRFPDAADELDFIRGVANSSYAQVMAFDDSKVPEELREKDHALAAEFSYAGAIYSFVLSTLLRIARRPDLTPSNEMVDAMFELARGAMLDLNDAAMEGARLREPQVPSVDDDDDVPADVGPDDLLHVEESIRKLERRGARA